MGSPCGRCLASFHIAKAFELRIPRPEDVIETPPARISELYVSTRICWDAYIAELGAAAHDHDISQHFEKPTDVLLVTERRRVERRSGERRRYRDRLDDATVTEIRKLFAEGMKQTDIGRRFSLPFITVSNIVKNKTYPASIQHTPDTNVISPQTDPPPNS